MAERLFNEREIVFGINVTCLITEVHLHEIRAVSCCIFTTFMMLT